MYSPWWSKRAAIIMFVGFFLTFLPQFVLGYNGMPRRYHRYVPEFQVWNVLSSAGASILAVGSVLPLCYLLLSLWYGKQAGSNPWRATGLEWQTPSPPPTENFETTPIVVRDPYQYHLEKAQKDPKPAVETGDRLRTHRSHSERYSRTRRAPVSTGSREPSADRSRARGARAQFFWASAARRAISRPGAAARHGRVRHVGFLGDRGDVFRPLVSVGRRLPLSVWRGL